MARDLSSLVPSLFSSAISCAIVDILSNTTRYTRTEYGPLIAVTKDTGEKNMALHDAHTPPDASQEEPQHEHADSPSEDTKQTRQDLLPEQTTSSATDQGSSDSIEQLSSAENNLAHSSDAKSLSEMPDRTAVSTFPPLEQPEATPLPETLADASDETRPSEPDSSEAASIEFPVEGTNETTILPDESSPSDQPTTTEAEAPTSTDTTEGNDAIPLPSMPTSQPSQPARKKCLDHTALLALCAALILLLLGSSGLILDLTYYHPSQVAFGATATANGQETATTNASQTQIADFEATGDAQAQATVQFYQNIYQSITRNKPTMNDALSHQSSIDWDEYSVAGQDACDFKNGRYHDEQIAIHFFNPCGEDDRGFGNFALQIDMTIVSGDYGGIMFRGHDGFFYFFNIDLDGYYSFNLYNYKKSNYPQQLDTGNTSYMQASNSATNEITLIAQENMFYIYVNGHFIETVTDGSYQSGWFGLIADSYQNVTDVAFSNLRIWQL